MSKIPPGGREVAEDVLRYKVDGAHWYLHEPTGTWMRSVTRLVKKYPTSEGLLRWQCSHGSYEAMLQELKKAAIRGHAVHEGIADLLEGCELRRRDFTDEQWKHLRSFVRWNEDYQPEIHGIEEVVYSLRRRLAGTLDIRCTLDGVHTIVDVKSSSGIFREMEIQVQAYAMLFNESHANGRPVEQVAVLRTGSRHKAGFEFKTFDLCERTAKLFKFLHFLDFDMDDSMEPRFPPPQPDTLSL